MKNKEISKTLLRMAQLLELNQENRFKIRAYQQAAQTLDDLTEDVEVCIRKETLLELPGIGKGIAEKIVEFCATGKMKDYDALKEKFPEGLLAMMEISGLGPKRTRLLFEKLKINSVEALRKAAQEGKLRNLEGFGPKVEENILKGISFHDEGPQRVLLSTARLLAENLAKTLRGRCRSIEECVPAGSLRRWKETVGDLDFLCISENPKEVIGEFVALSGVRRVLAQGDTKASFIHSSGVQCDLRVVQRESFGAALLYFTGSKEHNVALRELALKKGFTINEYGLCSLDNKNKILAGRAEEEIYKKLGLEFIPPELRENRGEIAAAQARKLPRLVEETDVRGDFHNHTKLSDGVHSLEQMAGKAKDKGWEWFVSADHSQSLKIARGLNKEALLKKKAEVSAINAREKNFRVLLGSEVDILADGSMDYEESLLRELDFVVGSLHSGFKQGEEKLTSRILAAMDNPHVDIIGHLTGRLIGSREPYPVTVQKVLDKALATWTALEINGQPHRMDLYDTHAKTAGETGVPLVLSTDAHSMDQLNYMTYAVAIARRAWLTKDHLLNCMSLDELLRWKREDAA